MKKLIRCIDDIEGNEVEIEVEKDMDWIEAEEEAIEAHQNKHPHLIEDANYKFLHRTDYSAPYITGHKI